MTYARKLPFLYIFFTAKHAINRLRILNSAIFNGIIDILLNRLYSYIDNIYTPIFIRHYVGYCLV